MKIKRKVLKQLRRDLASLERSKKEAYEIWDRYDEFQKWMHKHAPATVARWEDASGKVLPEYRPHTLDQMMKFYYAPAIRQQLQSSATGLVHSPHPA